MKGTTKLNRNLTLAVVMIICFLLFLGCTKAYYSAMEKVGVHKRDILADRVENARDAQSEAQVK